MAIYIERHISCNPRQVDNHYQIRVCYQFICSSMGNLPKEHYSFYGNSEHPIEGVVPVWSIKNEGKFIMRIKIDPQPQRISLYDQIDSQESFHLVRYFGNIFDSTQQSLFFTQQPLSSQSKQKITMVPSSELPNGQPQKSQKLQKLKQKLRSLKKQKKSKNQKQKEKGYLFWEFLNYDLTNLINDHKQKFKNISQEQITEILDSAINAGLTFAKFGIFIDFNFRVVQFAASRLPQIYWAHVLPNNMHRSFLRFIESQEVIEHAFYCPQQLESLKKETKIISMEKCSIYSLGMVILECMTLLPSKDFYDYHDFTINQKELANRIQLLKQKKVYGSSLIKLLQQFLEPRSNQRPGFKDAYGLLYA